MRWRRWNTLRIGSGVRITLLPLLALVGCAAPVAGDVKTLGHVRQPIVNGSISTAAHDAAVMLAEDGRLMCTATLIAPNLVLTARHCVSKINDRGGSKCGIAGNDMNPNTVGVALGVNASPMTTVAKGKKLFLPGNDMCGADVALIQLDRDLPGAKVAKVRFTSVRIGENTLAVGYGDDGTGVTTPSRFQRPRAKVLALGPFASSFESRDNKSVPLEIPAGDILTGETTCFGDSGGPLFDKDLNVIAVTSRGIDDSCIDRPSVWTALPQHEALIRNAATTAGHPLDAATSGGTATADDEEDKDESVADEDEDTTKQTKKLVAQTAGCAIGGHDTGGTPLGALALGALVLSSRSRGRRPRPSPSSTSATRRS